MRSVHLSVYTAPTGLDTAVGMDEFVTADAPVREIVEAQYEAEDKHFSHHGNVPIR